MQLNFSDLEYENRRRSARREEFLKKMNEILPWDKWCDLLTEAYPDGKKGRKPHPLLHMLKMYLIREWFSLSDTAAEEAIYDSYAMKSFLGLDFSSNEQVPDATTLCKFRGLLKKTGTDKIIAEDIKEASASAGLRIKPGSITEASAVKIKKRK